MASWTALLLVFFGLLGIGFLMGAARWRRETSQFIERLVQSAPQRGTAVSFERFKQLPAPVARYFRLALKDGQPFIRRAYFRQTGHLRIDEKSERWRRFEADQVVVPGRPGFVWDARIRLAPFVPVRVRDAYVAGRGSGQVSLLSVFPLAREQDRAELNSGALHRYLAEAVWCPTALLPDAGVHWRGLDDDRAVATLTDSGVTVSLEFRFDEAGEITGVYTPGRYGRFKGNYRLVPWEGHFRHYQERHGLRVPTEGEVGWHLPGGWWSFWKGNITEIHYDFAR